MNNRISLLLLLSPTFASPASGQFATGFDDAPSGCDVASAPQLTTFYATSGVSFSGGHVLRYPCSAVLLPPQSGSQMWILSGGLTAAPTPSVASATITFTTIWQSFSLGVVTYDFVAAPVAFDFYLDGALQLSSGPQYFSSTAWTTFQQVGLPFNEVRIHATDVPLGRSFRYSYAQFDDLHVGPAAEVVPEPASITLLATGLIGLGMRRGKAKNRRSSQDS